MKKIRWNKEKNKLNKEENALLNAFENEELHQVSSFENKKVQHQKYAQAKLKQQGSSRAAFLNQKKTKPF